MTRLNKFTDRIHIQFSRFVVIGSLAALLDMTVFLLALTWQVPRSFANIAGMTFGFLVGLFGHQHFTFRIQTRLTWGVFVRYGLTFLFNILLGIISLEALTHYEVNVLFAKLVTMCIVVASNFVISRHFVFEPPR